MNGDDEYLEDGFDDHNFHPRDQQDASPEQQIPSNAMIGQHRANLVGNGNIQNDLVDKEVE